MTKIKGKARKRMLYRVLACHKFNYSKEKIKAIIEEEYNVDYKVCSIKSLIKEAITEIEYKKELQRQNRILERWQEQSEPKIKRWLSQEEQMTKEERELETLYSQMSRGITQ